MVTVAMMPFKITSMSSELLLDVRLLTSDGGYKLFSVPGLHMDVVCNGLSIYGKD